MHVFKHLQLIDRATITGKFFLLLTRNHKIHSHQFPEPTMLIVLFSMSATEVGCLLLTRVNLALAKFFRNTRAFNIHSNENSKGIFTFVSKVYDDSKNEKVNWFVVYAILNTIETCYWNLTAAFKEKINFTFLFVRQWH